VSLRPSYKEVLSLPVLTGSRLLSVAVQGTGTGHLPLECQYFANEAEDGTPEAVTFCSNAADDVRLPGRVVATTALPAYALTDPLALPDSCTAASVVAAAWRLGDFQTSTAGNGSLRFNVELQTTDAPSGYPMVVAVDRWTAGETGWRPCVFGPSDGGLGPSDCTFRFDASTKELALEAQWMCSDLDAAHPYVLATLPILALELGRETRREPAEQLAC